jgi:hypothetical protein
MGALIAMLLTGPLMILSILVAIPLVLIFMALGGGTVVFFGWTLIWAVIWLMGADPDAAVNFAQALGVTCLSAMAIMALTWIVLAVKDVILLPFRPKRVSKSAATPLPPSPPAYPRPTALPANDTGFTPD